MEPTFPMRRHGSVSLRLQLIPQRKCCLSLEVICDQGANGTNTASDREKIYENMQALKKQIYSNGNATNAGRSVFTGYRTGESLTFLKDTEAYYRDIKDTFNASDVVKGSYTEGEIKMSEINALETGTPPTTTEQDVQEDQVYRIRLSYDDVETDGNTAVLTYRTELKGSQSPTLSIPETVTVGGVEKPGKDPVTGVIYGIKITDENGSETLLSSEDGFTIDNPQNTSGIPVSGGTVKVHNDGTFTYTIPGSPEKVYNISADGRTITSYYNEHEIKPVQVLNSYDPKGGKEDVYAYMRLGEDGKSEDSGTEESIFLVKDTGELILGSKIATTLSQLPNITGVDSISISYNKTRFSEGES